MKLTNTDPHARSLAERLAGLPLALATAGLYLYRARAVTFEDYLNESKRRWNPDPRGALLKLREYQVQGLNEDDRTLYTTWNISYKRLEAEDALAARLLKLLAYFDYQQLWYELFCAGLDRNLGVEFHNIFKDSAIFNSIARTLVDYGFLEWNDASQFWSMHACVHDWTLAVLNQDIESAHYWYAFHCVTTLIGRIAWEEIGNTQHAWLAPHTA